MLLHPANLLVLDEPTNHLDLDSKDVLLDALKRFDGTVLFVSHDRFFIEGLADRVLELSCGTSPRLYYGDYAYYLSKKAEDMSAGTASAFPASAAPRAFPARERNQSTRRRRGSRTSAERSSATGSASAKRNCSPAWRPSMRSNQC